jgi:intracellular multiplication protein IcmE
MEEALHEENNRRVEEARRTGSSVITMPVDPMRGQLPMQFEEEEAEDPLERWRQMQEDRLRNSQVRDRAVEQPVPVEVDTRTPAVNALSEAMAVQMEAILNNQGISPMKVRQVSPEDYLVRLQREDEERRQIELAKLQEQQAQISLDGDTTAVVLVPAGTIEYAQMITEANTDAPGPILAQIASGPLKGARLIGSFSSTDDYLTLNFNTVVLDGISYGVSAVALDPDTTLPGVATDVNRRYLQRVALPAAAAFITGLTEAIAQSGSTTVTIQGETVSEETQDLDSEQEVSAGIAEAGEEVGEILDEMGDGVEPLIRVRAGTPIGILFTAPVFDQPVTANSAS